MLLYENTINNIISSSVIFNNIDNKDDIIKRFINKKLLFLEKLKKYNVESKNKNLLYKIIVYIEILDFIKNDMLSLPELDYIESNGIEKKNENIFILFYLETSSNSIKNIISLLEQIIDTDLNLNKNIHDIKDLFLENINPLHNYFQDEIDSLLSKENTSSDCFNKLKKESFSKTMEFVEKLIETILQ
tara:strand:- start:107 stop:670 length:564 start_codon:yes stop_codon:yes gene_type:complete